MDWRNFLDVVLALLAGWLAYRNFTMSSKKETQRESAEMTEIKVQLTQAMGMLRDIQKDIRTSSADFRALDKQVTVLETRLEEAFSRLEKLEEINGKQ